MSALPTLYGRCRDLHPSTVGTLRPDWRCRSESGREEIRRWPGPVGCPLPAAGTTASGSAIWPSRVETSRSKSASRYSAASAVESLRHVRFSRRVVIASFSPASRCRTGRLRCGFVYIQHFLNYRFCEEVDERRSPSPRVPETVAISTNGQPGRVCKGSRVQISPPRPILDPADGHDGVLSVLPQAGVSSGRRRAPPGLPVTPS